MSYPSVFNSIPLLMKLIKRQVPARWYEWKSECARSGNTPRVYFPLLLWHFIAPCTLSARSRRASATERASFMNEILRRSSDVKRYINVTGQTREVLYLESWTCCSQVLRYCLVYRVDETHRQSMFIVFTLIIISFSSTAIVCLIKSEKERDLNLSRYKIIRYYVVKTVIILNGYLLYIL